MFRQSLHFQKIQISAGLTPDPVQLGGCLCHPKGSKVNDQTTCLCIRLLASSRKKPKRRAASNHQWAERHILVPLLSFQSQLEPQ